MFCQEFNDKVMEKTNDILKLEEYKSNEECIKILN